MVEAYRTGRGRVVVRGRAHNEPLKGGANAIVFTELPYQVNKAELIRKMADLANDKVVPEIRDLRDESGRDGVRVVVELRRDAVPMVVLNKLYKHTAAQTTFGVNAIALVDGVPRTLGLADLIGHYLDHQREVVTRRSRYRLERAEARAHILEGLLVALENLDDVIALIRGAIDPDEARTGLMTRFDLTELQARAILDLRLQRLTQLEAGKIQEEYGELQERIAELRAILGDEARVYALIREELVAIRERYADERRTEIVPGEGDLDLEDLIAEEEMVISISRAGYVKRLPVSTYRAQGRGGKGLRGVRLKDEDYIEHLFIASTHHYLLFFTNTGKVYRQKVHELPQGARDSRGRHIANVLALREGEEVRAVFATRDYSEGRYLVPRDPRRDGQEDRDAQLRHHPARGGADRHPAHRRRRARGGPAHRRGRGPAGGVGAGPGGPLPRGARAPHGPDTRGVRGMTLEPEDRVLALAVARDDEDLLVVTGNGYGKRTLISELPGKGRPTKGVRTIKVTDSKGELVTARPVREGQELLLISQNGQVIRIAAESVRRTGRSTEGVRLMNLADDDARGGGGVGGRDAGRRGGGRGGRRRGLSVSSAARRGRRVAAPRSRSAISAGDVATAITPVPSSSPASVPRRGIRSTCQWYRPSRPPTGTVQPEVDVLRAEQLGHGGRLAPQEPRASAGPGAAVQSGRCAAGAMRTVPLSGGTSGDHATRPSASATMRPSAAASMSAQTGQRASANARSRASSRGGSIGSPTSWAWVCCRDAPAAAPWLRKRKGQSPRASASTAAIRSAQTPPAVPASSSVRSPNRTRWRGVFTITSWTPSSGATAGNLFGTARTSHPGVSGPPAARPDRLGLRRGLGLRGRGRRGTPCRSQAAPHRWGRAARAGGQQDRLVGERVPPERARDPFRRPWDVPLFFAEALAFAGFAFPPPSPPPSTLRRRPCSMES